MALTKEFAVIQGPPGTGKTYIGLKVDLQTPSHEKLSVIFRENQWPFLLSSTESWFKAFLAELIEMSLPCI